MVTWVVETVSGMVVLPVTTPVEVEERSDSCKVSSDLYVYTQIHKNVIKIVKSKLSIRVVLTE